jgi:actin-like ATPase involved in cell morphogenesis
MGLNEMFKKIASIESEKMELGKHEVNLAIADDVKKSYNEAITARKKAFDIMQKIKAETATALKQLNDIKAINQKALPIFDKFEVAAKELGLPLPAEIKQQKENIQEGLKGALTSYSKTLESIKIS